MKLAQDVLAGKRLALARLLTHIENGTPEGRVALDALFPHTGKAYLIGVTGAPGTGKSSLVNQLARFYRRSVNGSTPRKVAIVAVDPSSPFTGGAVLGDRIRMQDLAGDRGVFIRSMASRGALGGIAAATAGVVQAFDAAGYEIILIETVGAGQAEVDIAKLAHTTLVVEAPGLGDDIQAIKAGILEIADILVVNKADRPGVENTERALKNMLQLAHPAAHVFRHHGQIMEVQGAAPAQEEAFWLPPVLRTVAIEDVGIDELAAHIARHREHLESSGDWIQRERVRLQNELNTLIQTMLVARWRESISEGEYQHTLDALVERRLSPHQAVTKLLAPVTH